MPFQKRERWRDYLPRHWPDEMSWLHRIGGHGYNRYLRRRRLQLLSETRTDDVNNVWPGLSHLLSEGRKSFRLSGRSPSINPNGFVLDVAEPRQLSRNARLLSLNLGVLDITSTG